jgi:PAS domain S-box-containing protein
MLDKNGSALSISGSILKSILNGMNAFLYVTDPETDEILFVNDKMIKQFSLEENCIGKICWQLLRDDMTERCDFCPLHKMDKNSDETITWEIYNPPTGRYFQCNDKFIHWTGGRLAHLQHATDITERKMIERDITERLEQQELMSSISQSFILLDSTENLINSAFKTIGEFMHVSFIMLMEHNPEDKLLILKNSWNEVGCPHDFESVPFHEETLEYYSFITRHMEDIVYDDIADVEYMTHLSQCGVKSFVQVPLWVKGVFWGILFVNQCDYRVWNASDIQLIGLIGSLITGVIDRNRIEKRFLQMAGIVSSSPQFISYVNTEGKIELINQGALDILGYRMDELLEKNISLFLSEQDYRDVVKKYIPKIWQEGRLEVELPVIRKDGEIRILDFSAFRTNSESQGINVIAEDVTEKKRLEKKLIVAMEQAEASSQAKSEFLSRMSHEMRTPMNAIIGMTKIAKSSHDSVKKEYCLDKIDDASNHLLGVINDVLDMSKIEAGKLELSETEFLFEKMLIRVIDVVLFKIEEKKQKLVLHIDPTMSNFVFADEQRFTQVLTNLFSNAVKFTPEGGTITLTVENIKIDNDFIVKRVIVTDTGIGISKQQQENLFQSFEQADGSISRKFGGTGLGLVISKKIIELMGGSIRIESELGQGASFIFEIAIKKGQQSRMSLLDTKINWKNLRILAVDDNQNALNYLKGLSNSIDMFCETSLSGEEALETLEKYRDNPFDIIFVDYLMPGMNGLELTKKIKTCNISSVVILMASIKLWEDIEQDAIQAGIHTFLPKPLFSTQIVDCIATSLRPEKKTDTSLDKENDMEGVFNGFRILLAEDIEINQEIVKSLLEPTGIVIDCAENGLEAIQAFKENPSAYNAILMDIHMPEIDGYEATRRIRQLNQGNSQSVTIIAMTANVFKEDVEKCFAAGMNDHVGKPINFDDLIGKLKMYLLNK